MGAEIPIFKVNISLLSYMIYGKHRHEGRPSPDPGVYSLSIHGVLIPHSQALHFPSQHTDFKNLFSWSAVGRGPYTSSPPTHAHHSTLCQTQVTFAQHHTISESHSYTESGILQQSCKIQSPVGLREEKNSAHTGLGSCFKKIKNKINSLINY